MVVRKCVLHLIIIKWKSWIISHCLGLGHETINWMVCAVYLAIFLWTCLNVIIWYEYSWIYVSWICAPQHAELLYITLLSITRNCPHAVIKIHIIKMGTRLYQHPPKPSNLITYFQNFTTKYVKHNCDSPHIVIMVTIRQWVMYTR